MGAATEASRHSEHEEHQKACKQLEHSQWPNVYPTWPKSQRVAMKEKMDPIDFFRALKKKQNSQNPAITESTESLKWYVDCRFIAPTSVEVEVLFSMCGHLMSDSRRHMQPVLFEAIVFLRRNANWWTKDDWNTFFAMRGEFKDVFECDEDEDEAW